jgi:hypothetical protein
MADMCIVKLGVIAKEIAVLQPRHVIFYTYAGPKENRELFRAPLRRLPAQLSATYRDVTPEETTVICGRKPMGWWDRSFDTAWCTNMRVLVTGHPERKDKEEYVEKLVNWIRQGESKA